MSDRKIIDIGPQIEVEIPPDVLAKIEEYAAAPHHNAYPFTPLQDAVLLKAKRDGLTWHQIREVLADPTITPEGRVPKNGALLNRFRELGGE